jgi:hypothetical protein
MNRTAKVFATSGFIKVNNNQICEAYSAAKPRRGPFDQKDLKQEA